MSQQTPSEDTTGQAPSPQLAQEVRAGCGEAEAALLWATARFGGQTEVRRGLGPSAAAQLTRTLERLDAVGDEDARARVVAAWEALDRSHDDPRQVFGRAPTMAQQRVAASLKPRWLHAAQRLTTQGARAPAERACAQLLFGGLRADPHHLRPALIAVDEARFDVGMLCGFGPREVSYAAQRLGAFTFADMLRPRERRQIASVLKTLPEHLRAWVINDLRRDLALDERVRARAQEVFVVMRGRHEGWDMLFGHLGLYMLAASAGRRHSARLSWLAERLPPDLGADLLRYGQMSRQSSRGLIDDPLCRAIAQLHDELLPPQRGTTP